MWNSSWCAASTSSEVWTCSSPTIAAKPARAAANRSGVTPGGRIWLIESSPGEHPTRRRARRAGSGWRSRSPGARGVRARAAGSGAAPAGTRSRRASPAGPAARPCRTARRGRTEMALEVPAVGIEAVGILEDVVVTAGGPEVQRDERARRDGDAADLHVLGGTPERETADVRVAQLLLDHEVEAGAIGVDRARHRSPPSASIRATSWPMRFTGRVPAGDDRQRDRGEDLLVVEPTAALVVLRPQQVADEVASGRGAARRSCDEVGHEALEVRLPVGQLDERRLVERRIAHEPHRVARPRVELVLDGRVDAEDRGHHAHRAAPGEDGEQVGLAVGDELVDGGVEELADARLVGQRGLAGEGTLRQLADAGVLVGVVPGEHPGPAPQEPLRQDVRGPLGDLEPVSDRPGRAACRS